MTIEKNPKRNGRQSFHQTLRNELEELVNKSRQSFPIEETLTIDLHCHDKNSDVPDEILGRLLGVPETYLPTETLIENLSKSGCDTFTITNHNNSRSCKELREKGVDILTGAEFSCMVPDYKIGIHVLAYGFSEAQEKDLNRLRKDLYLFLDYARQNEIPTIWAHPLYHYKSDGLPPMDFFEKMALCFERFEALNGQRDTWQNVLVIKWVESLTPERIDRYSKKYSLAPDRFCATPYRKSVSGGSDSHMGLFSGQTGTLLHVPGLQDRLKTEKRSDLALEAIRKGQMAPFGVHNDSEKMSVTFLDYFCQLGLNMEDPGLIRLLLHKGSSTDKLKAFMIANTFLELRKHRITMDFIRIFHQSLRGKTPGLLKKMFISSEYKPVFKEVQNIASMRNGGKEESAVKLDRSLKTISGQLNAILFSRMKKHFPVQSINQLLRSEEPGKLIDKFELPVYIRDILGNSNEDNGNRGMNISKLLDNLSFPFLASAVITAANYVSARVLYKSRPLLKEFASSLGAPEHPERMLWLTDTFDDKNGVAIVLRQFLEVIKEKSLPIDILVCSSKLKSEDNLIVVNPIEEFSIPGYSNQNLRIPDILTIHDIFKNGEYDRIICSTEGPMGLISLYLKNAYSVPAYFYAHTDWMSFVNRVLKLDKSKTDRIRRLLRAFYRSFDGIFVLNKNQHRWFTGSGIGIPESKVYRTAHWADPIFKPIKKPNPALHGNAEDYPVMLYAGRLSEEKGVTDLPAIFKKVRESVPNLRMIIAGTGPAEDWLKNRLPEAEFTGWVKQTDLPAIYSSADILVLPSRFDTFGCVVLEAMSCGCPVAAYNTRGPADIIDHMQNGYLAENKTELAGVISSHLTQSAKRQSFRAAALRKSALYKRSEILKEFLINTGLD